MSNSIQHISNQPDKPSKLSLLENQAYINNLGNTLTKHEDKQSKSTKNNFRIDKNQIQQF